MRARKIRGFAPMNEITKGSWVVIFALLVFVGILAIGANRAKSELFENFEKMRENARKRKMLEKRGFATKREI